MTQARISGQRQLQEWETLITKTPSSFGKNSAQIIEDYPLQYKANVQITDTKDLITKGYVDSLIEAAVSDIGQDITQNINGSMIAIGNPADGTYIDDGLLRLTSNLSIAESIDLINEVLIDLAPLDALELSGKNLDIFNKTTTKYSGHLSYSATSNYKLNEGAGTLVDYIIKDVPFTLITPNTTTAINKGDLGILNLYINDIKVDSFDLVAKFNEIYRNGVQQYTELSKGVANDYTSPKGFIIINDVRKYNCRMWQKCIVKINIKSENLREGYNKIVLKHEGIKNTQTSDAFNLYYDNDSGANPTMTLTSLTTNTGSTYLSGINFLKPNDTITFSATVNNAINNVYSESIVKCTIPDLVDESILYSDSCVTGLSSPPKIKETITITNKVLTINRFNSYITNAKLKLEVQDPYGSYSPIIVPDQKILMSPYDSTGISSNTVEMFTNEYYRLPLTYNFEDKTTTPIGLWNSSISLTNGNAQVYMTEDNLPALIYPNIDFSNGFLPLQTANYSTFSGSQQYVRAFIASTTTRTGLQVQFEGLLGGIGTLGTGDVNIEVKLPTATAWLDCAKAYNATAGVNTEGNGCLNGNILYTSTSAGMVLSFGSSKTSGLSNKILFMRITFNNPNRIIKKINCTSW